MFFIGCASDHKSGLCVPLLFYFVVFWVCHLKEEAFDGLELFFSFLDCICDVHHFRCFFVLRNDFCIYTIVFIYYCLVAAVVVPHLICFLAIYTLYLVMIACLTVHWSAVFFVSIFLFIVSNI